MKIAVTYTAGEVFQHFGHTEQFKIYDVKDNKVVSSEIINTNGTGHGALAGLLSAFGVDVLICGGIGGGAQTALTNANIKFYGGVKGNADDAVEKLLTGKLSFDPDIKCSHHGEHDHNCGDHNCGNHNCGEHH